MSPHTNVEEHGSLWFPIKDAPGQMAQPWLYVLSPTAGGMQPLLQQRGTLSHTAWGKVVIRGLPPTNTTYTQVSISCTPNRDHATTPPKLIFGSLSPCLGTDCVLWIFLVRHEKCLFNRDKTLITNKQINK